MMFDMDLPTLLTTAQVAARIGKSGATVRRLAESGDLAAAAKLPPPNGTYLFTIHAVEAWERAQGVAA